ncbi:heterokaryon incompatibility protein-domain-containing protein, partial [Halenospora varia]
MWNTQIDPELVRNWFENLPAQVEKGTNFLPPVIRPHFCLIDAEKECVVKVQEPSQYVALSYVWGNANTVLNKEERRPFLMRPGGVSLSDPKLPKTIHDALRLVLATGHRYLWVDALCVSQDPGPGSSHGKTAQLENMDSIYRCAKFTIIAVSGEDANAGLPGIRDGTRTWQPHIRWFRGIKLSSRPPTRNSLNTIWGSRAWTLQEEVFSERKLYFSSHTMRLRHEHGFFDEDLHPQRVVGDHDPESKKIKSLRTNFTTYADFVKHYTGRSMTNNTDVINAFQGVLTALRPNFRGDFLAGLPSTELEHALLWLPAQPVKRRIESQKTGLNKVVRTICPSWSWTGWEGGEIQY